MKKQKMKSKAKNIHQNKIKNKNNCIKLSKNNKKKNKNN